MHSYFYFEGTDGRHYCYAKEPTFHCPMVDPLLLRPQLDAPEAPPAELAPATAEVVTAAAKLLGMDPIALARAIRGWHQRRSEVRARVDGKLTNTCAACRHTLKRLGFRVWIEELPSEEDAQSRIAGRLGFSDWRTVEGSAFYCDTKKEATAWARDEAKIVRV